MIRNSTQLGTICKRVEIKIFVPGQKRVVHVIRAKPGTWLTDKLIHGLLMQECLMLERDLPKYQFHFMQIAFDKYNIAVAEDDQEKAWANVGFGMA